MSHFNSWSVAFEVRQACKNTKGSLPSFRGLSSKSMLATTAECSKGAVSKVQRRLKMWDIEVEAALGMSEQELRGRCCENHCRACNWRA